MKKILFPIVLLLLIISCSKDDEGGIITIPTCNTPENIQVSDITSDSAIISWEATNTSASYTIEYGVSGFSQGNGTSITNSNTTITLENLASNTSYDVYIQSVCSPTNVSVFSDVTSFTTIAPLVATDFLPNLSDFNLFAGDLENLTPSVYAFEYELNTPLFTDYAHKQRLIVLPPGTSMTYVNDGLPDFPDNTLISKTFYYNNDERDTSLGKKIIETRILIKKNGTWEFGNYIWNDSQTEATLDSSGNGGTSTFSYIDNSGSTQNLNYEIPTSTQCLQCHNSNDVATPIGPKLRTMNMSNQLQNMIDQNLLTNLSNPSTVSVLPNWEDTSYSLEERARAYFDVNCAHCHSPGGDCYPESNLDFRYETSLRDSNITEHGPSIKTRTQSLIQDYSMPLIGTTILHPEGYTLIEDYIDTL
ncbi:fibronectin type III domain-containing protein [Corallibacter sp.]|uniref:fibronectin type III domain-containing protein n=1 Tax=Corallibacter sp. TaxID=2038084 RepID=UPI003A936F2B